ncbi:MULTISPECIES: hypothetical protein [unclassified Natrinema]|uniref:DUF7553 family protein n=1 Tax=unclassified Natrinema TaxID=2622230 RepID=UPI00026D45FC|nr:MULTISPECIES: hypothetical protein [unclassified Natrinema]AFO55550.1 hypothetical protein NJ7G_0297 [Natrinema sp. J7-2]
MARTELESAAESIAAAATAASDDETRERLQNQAAKFEDYATAEHGPDHGQLARHEHILKEIAGDEGGDVAADIDDALEAITEFRSTLEGV